MNEASSKTDSGIGGLAYAPLYIARAALGENSVGTGTAKPVSSSTLVLLIPAKAVSEGGGKLRV